MTNQTTGTLVYYRKGSYVGEHCIGRDLGPYPGCREGLNVRRIEQTDTLTGLDSVLADQITARDGYGCGWGETSALYPITEAEAETLRAACTPSAVDDEAAMPESTHWYTTNEYGERELIEDC